MSARTSPAPTNHHPHHTVPRPSPLIARLNSHAPASTCPQRARTRLPASPKSTPRPEFAHVSSPATLVQPPMTICRLCHAAFAGDALLPSIRLSLGNAIQLPRRSSYAASRPAQPRASFATRSRAVRAHRAMRRRRMQRRSAARPRPRRSSAQRASGAVAVPNLPFRRAPPPLWSRRTIRRRSRYMRPLSAPRRLMR